VIAVARVYPVNACAKPMLISERLYASLKIKPCELFQR